MSRLFLALAAIPASVSAFSLMEGASGYLSGTAAIRGVGYPGPEYGNLDPEYRVYRPTSGCLVMGTEILTHVPNNVAIALLTKVFGPMRGTYRGPYPSRDEAGDALRGSRMVVALDVLEAPPQPAPDCQALSNRFPPREDRPVARCATFRDRTIVLGHAGQATLVDPEPGVAYARYRVE
jgi:hypothetical protein